MTGETVKIAQLGAGYWGKNLARNFAQLGALAAVCDPHRETAAREAAANKVEARALDEVLADASIDGVSIAAPAELHADLAIKAFKAGKHVFVEKPLALTHDDCMRMCAAAEGAGKVLMVGHLLQYHPAFETLLGKVRAGEIGKLRYAYSTRASLGKLRTEEDVLWSFAPHDVSMLLALFADRPETVHGVGGSFVTPDIEDEYRLDMSFAGGGRAHVFASWLHPFKEHRLVVVGETGMLVFEDSAAKPEDKLRLYRHKIETGKGAPNAIKAEPEAIAYSADEPLKRECAHFLECCRTGARPRTDGHEAMAVVDTLLRAEGKRG
ncbi:oxidoreductase of Gfo/Idh/MocA family [alpha proteobacterium U9-1i]|nr:oxidoreductase of Gfo/Idh/MocA family [alpha proteobacterium U9-1i]